MTRTVTAGAVRILLEALCGPWIQENPQLDMILINVSCHLMCVCVCVGGREEERGREREREGMYACVFYRKDKKR